jgi:hypothetical protein
MRICWDDLDGVYLSKRGNFRKGSTTYVYKYKCINCGRPYLTEKSRPSKYCSNFCATTSIDFKHKLSKANIGVKNSMYGKRHSKDSLNKISTNRRGKMMGDGNHNFGGLKESTKKKLSLAHKGKKLTKETRLKMSLVRKGMGCGPTNPMWRGGKSFEEYCVEWTDDLKTLIKYRDGNKCLNPYCYKNDSKIVVHHIDYDKKNCTFDNLISVCSSCNSRANKDRGWHKSWYKAT